MPKFIDLTGKKFGKLTVLSWAGRNKFSQMMWKCKCDCGNEVLVAGGSLKSGNTQSCGCLVTKHGMRKSRLYTIWRGIKKRCLDKNAPNYSNYGGRGIAICDEWIDFIPFMEWSLANGYEEKASKSGCTIDRIDNDKGYSPENCRWVTRVAQANNKRNNVTITKGGETHTISEWSRITGINPTTLRFRKLYGWGEDKIFSKPRRRQR